jgi:CHAD domain-containing protein
MPFHVKKSETPGRAARRIGRECIAESRSRLRHGGHSAAIHGARKEIKKLRALLQLVRGAIRQPVYRKVRKALRGAAKQLAATRDARVMLKAFESLAENASRQHPMIWAALKKQARRQARRFRKNGAATQAEKLLRKAGRHMGAIRSKADGWAAFAPGLENCYQRGGRAFLLAGREPRPEYFHTWRRRVKQLWYCLCLLRPAWTPATRRRMNALELLGEKLGQEHDLHLLAEFLRKHNFAPEMAGIADMIANERRRLRSASLKLGARLYSQTSSAFCRQLQSEWNDWRKASNTSRHCK